MATTNNNNLGRWSGRYAFILAATGSAVGLGNIWKFPYITGENGGGAFVLVYLVCIACVGIPILIAEIMLGRRGRDNPIGTMGSLAEAEGRSANWKIIGFMGVLAGFLILSYYSVIAGWALSYVVRAATGEFTGLDGVTSGTKFGGFISSTWQPLMWHSVFMVMTMFVVARGVEGGLEKAVRFLMPGLLIILVMLVVYATTTGAFMQGVSFLFEPDFSKLTRASILTAMGHAFFTLSLGMGAIMIYGAYLPKKVSIASSAVLIAGMDTLVAMLAGLAIFPIVFAYGLEPGAGPGLIFQTLPIAFGEMPGGMFIGTLFFVMLVFAAWSSSISLVEPAVTWIMEKWTMTRLKAALIVGGLTWILGIGTVLSFNIWAFSFEFAGETKTGGIFDVFDILTANFMLPIGGMLIAIFAGWRMHRKNSSDELGIAEHSFAYKTWLFMVRFIAPTAVFIVAMQVILKAVGINLF